MDTPTLSEPSDGDPTSFPLPLHESSPRPDDSAKPSRALSKGVLLQAMPTLEPSDQAVPTLEPSELGYCTLDSDVPDMSGAFDPSYHFTVGHPPIPSTQCLSPTTNVPPSQPGDKIFYLEGTSPEEENDGSRLDGAAELVTKEHEASVLDMKCTLAENVDTIKKLRDQLNLKTCENEKLQTEFMIAKEKYEAEIKALTDLVDGYRVQLANLEKTTNKNTEVIRTKIECLKERLKCKEEEIGRTREAFRERELKYEEKRKELEKEISDIKEESQANEMAHLKEVNYIRSMSETEVTRIKRETEQEISRIQNECKDKVSECDMTVVRIQAKSEKEILRIRAEFEAKLKDMELEHEKRVNSLKEGARNREQVLEKKVGDLENDLKIKELEHRIEIKDRDMEHEREITRMREELSAKELNNSSNIQQLQQNDPNVLRQLNQTQQRHGYYGVQKDSKKDHK